MVSILHAVMESTIGEDNGSGETNTAFYNLVDIFQACVFFPIARKKNTYLKLSKGQWMNESSVFEQDT